MNQEETPILDAVHDLLNDEYLDEEELDCLSVESEFSDHEEKIPSIEWKVQRSLPQAEDIHHSRTIPLLTEIADISSKLKASVHLSSVDALMFEKERLERELSQANAAYLEYLKEVAKNPQKEFTERSRLEEMLLIYSHRSKILTELQQHGTLVLQAPTGSGKSTAVPLYVYEMLQETKQDHPVGSVLVVLPRVLAAKGVCSRIIKTNNLHRVKYAPLLISNKNSISKLNSGLFFTSEIWFLDIIKQNPKLSGFSAVIIDEVHERTVFTDVILSLLASLRETRRDLFVLTMSATLDSDLLRTFMKAGFVSISGRNFRIEEVQDETPTNVNMFSLSRYAARRVFEIVNDSIRKNDIQEFFNKSQDDESSLDLLDDLVDSHLGSFVVFLPGRRECELAMSELERISQESGSLWRLEVDKFGRAVEINEQMLKKMKKLLGSNVVLFQPVAVHGGMRFHDKESSILHSPHRRVIKVIFSTNITETALTISNVSHVIDFGLVNLRIYDPKRNCEILKTCPASQSSLEQRKGRTGRTRPGFYHKCYDGEASEFPRQRAQILHSSLDLFFLKILTLGFDPFGLRLPTPPQESHIKYAKESLARLGALDEHTKLTSFGQLLARSPVSPILTTIGYELVQAGFQYGALIASTLSIGSSLFFFGWTEAQRFESRNARFNITSRIGNESEHLVIAAAFADAALRKYQTKYMSDVLSLNGKFVRATRELFDQLKGLLSPRKKFNDQFGLPGSVEQLKDCLPVLKTLLLKHFPENIILLSDVNMGDSGNIRLVYKAPGSNDQFSVGWLTSPEIPAEILHYRQLALMELEDGSRVKLVHDVTNVSDQKLDIDCKWKVTSWHVDSLPSGIMFLLVSSWRNLTQSNIFLWSPRIIRTIESRDAMSPMMQKRLFELNCNMVFIHPRSVDVFDELNRLLNSNFVFQSDKGTLGFVGDGLRVIETMSFVEDYAKCAQSSLIGIPFIDPSRVGTTLCLPEKKLKFKVDKDDVKDRLLNSGCILTEQSEEQFLYLVLVPRQQIDIALIFCPSADIAEKSLSVVQKYTDVVHCPTLRLEEVDGKEFYVVEGETSFPPCFIELVLQEEGCFQYSFVRTKSYARNRVLAPTCHEHDLPNTLKNIFPTRRVRKRYHDLFWVCVDIQMTESEAMLVEESLGAYVLRQYSSVKFIPGKNRRQSVARLKKVLLKFPKDSWTPYDDHVTLNAFTEEALQRMVLQVDRILRYKRLPPEVEMSLFSLRFEDMRDILNSESIPVPISVDHLRQQIRIMVFDEKQFGECTQLLKDSCAHATLEFKQRLELPTRICIALSTFMQSDVDAAFDMRRLDEYDHLSSLFKEITKLSGKYLIQVSVSSSSIMVSASSASLLVLICEKLASLSDGEENFQDEVLLRPDYAGSFYSCFHVCPNGQPAGFRLRNCSHKICLECLRMYVQVGVNSIKKGTSMRIRCPLKDCHSDISLADLKLFVTNTDIRECGMKLFDRYIQVNQEKYILCPSLQCGRPLIRSPRSIYRQMYLPDVSVKCQSCGFQVCTVCGRDAHPNMMCSVSKKGGDESMIDMTGRKRCPQCFTITEKAEGCNHVQCFFCGVHYCWKCGFASDQHNVIYEHMRQSHGSIFTE